MLKKWSLFTGFVFIMLTTVITASHMLQLRLGAVQTQLSGHNINGTISSDFSSLVTVDYAYDIKFNQNISIKDVYSSEIKTTDYAIMIDGVDWAVFDFKKADMQGTLYDVLVLRQFESYSTKIPYKFIVFGVQGIVYVEDIFLDFYLSKDGVNRQIKKMLPNAVLHIDRSDTAQYSDLMNLDLIPKSTFFLRPMISIHLAAQSKVVSVRSSDSNRIDLLDVSTPASVGMLLGYASKRSGDFSLYLGATQFAYRVSQGYADTLIDKAKHGEKVLLKYGVLYEKSWLKNVSVGLSLNSYQTSISPLLTKNWKWSLTGFQLSLNFGYRF